MLIMAGETPVPQRYNGIDPGVVDDLRKGLFYTHNNDNDFAKDTIIKAIQHFYNTNGLFRKIINMPARDATKKDIIIHGDTNKKILAELNKKQYRNNLEKATRIARLYGSALVVMNVQTDNTINENFDTQIKADSGIKEFAVQYIFAPNEFCIEKNDNYPLDWEYYVINAGTGMTNMLRVHKSRAILITFQELCRRADRLFDGSIFLHIFNDITRYTDALDVEANLMIQSQYDILQIKPTEGDLEQERQKQREIVRQNAYAKKNGGTEIIGIDDKISRIQSIFTGYAEVSNSFKDVICASASIPETLLFGKIISGLSNESNTALADYYSTVENLQEDCLRDAYARLIELACRKLGIGINNYHCFEFANLWSIDGVEKSQIITNYANAADKFINNDICTKEEIRQFLDESDIIKLNAKAANQQKNNEEDVEEIY